MFHQHRMDRSFPFAVCGAAAMLLCATSVSAAKTPKVNACRAAHTKAEESAQSGHLREARELFESCAKPACGGYLNQECTSQVTELDADIPSVVPVVTDGQNAPQVDIEVKMDGAVLASKLGGQALPVDPGVHEFTFSAGEQVFATQKLMIVQGQRNRPVPISMGSPNQAASAASDVATSSKSAGGNAASDVATSSKPAGGNAASDKSSADEGTPSVVTSQRPPARRSAGAAPWIVGSVGLMSLGAGALLVSWGRSDNASLVTNCPNGGCSQVRVDHVETMYLVGDIAAGAGLTAVVVSTVWLLAGSGSTAEKPPAAARYKFDVQPARSGGLAMLSGAF